MKKFILYFAAFSAIVCLSAFADAGCGGGSGRIGLRERFNNHRQLRAEHIAHNINNRKSRGAMMIVIPPAQAPKAVIVPAAPIGVMFSTSGCASGQCGTSARFRR